MVRGAVLLALAASASLALSLRVGPLLPGQFPKAGVRPLSMLLGMGQKKPGPPRTVGDAKAAFQQVYGAPVPSMGNSFVNEMLTSVTLATVTPSYKYTRIFAVGFEALCDSFLVALPTEEMRVKIHDSMCEALELDAKQLKSDAAALKEAVTGISEEELLALPDFKEIAEGDFKYSYPFGAGLLTLMPLVNAPPTPEVIDRWCSALGMSSIRLQKDWTFFEKAVQQMAEGRQMLMEMQASAKRKEAKALQEKADKAAADAAAEESTEATEETTA